MPPGGYFGFTSCNRSVGRALLAPEAVTSESVLHRVDECQGCLVVPLASERRSGRIDARFRFRWRFWPGPRLLLRPISTAGLIRGIIVRVTDFTAWHGEAHTSSLIGNSYPTHVACIRDLGHSDTDYHISEEQRPSRMAEVPGRKCRTPWWIRHGLMETLVKAHAAPRNRGSQVFFNCNAKFQASTHKQLRRVGRSLSTELLRQKPDLRGLRTCTLMTLDTGQADFVFQDQRSQPASSQLSHGTPNNHWSSQAFKGGRSFRQSLLHRQVQHGLLGRRSRPAIFRTPYKVGLR